MTSRERERPCGVKNPAAHAARLATNSSWRIARAVVAEIIVKAINGLNLDYPKVSAEMMEKVVAARNFLEDKDA